MADNAVDIDLHHLIPFGRPTKLPKKVIIVHTTENSLGTTSRNIVDYQVRTRTAKGVAGYYSRPLTSLVEGVYPQPRPSLTSVNMVQWQE